jgi:hypothetical protein
VTAKENPGVGTGASEDSGESTTDTILPPIRPSASKRLQLSPTAEAWITARAHDLATGQLEFWQLPPSLVEFYYVAFCDGMNKLIPELTQAHRDADRYYGIAYNPAPKIDPNAKTFAELEAARAAIYGGASA